ncbi:MAG: hypothetical protein FJ115_03235 [Deltaproteobacteria bacterium]|nr:hypothetical protein [Deltaproteobacteria bacterium]MBM4322550.1 hypothetical protein [Deltaproteobacteria bacterium]
MIKQILFILSAIYVSCIFILPRLITQQSMEQIWNPYSLLHIPLYGVLMVLLTFAFLPNLAHAKSSSSFKPLSLLLPGGIATFVGVLDEVNQIFIPYRDASITDVLLDMGGIVLVVLLILYWQKRKKGNGSLEKVH